MHEQIHFATDLEAPSDGREGPAVPIRGLTAGGDHATQKADAEKESPQDQRGTGHPDPCEDPTEVDARARSLIGVAGAAALLAAAAPVIVRIVGR